MREKERLAEKRREKIETKYAVMKESVTSKEGLGEKKERRKN